MKGSRGGWGVGEGEVGGGIGLRRTALRKICLSSGTVMPPLIIRIDMYDMDYGS